MWHLHGEKRVPKRIIIADGSKKLLSQIASSPDAFFYEIIEVTSGPEFLKKLGTIQPDLAIVDLMLPKMHGIEILHLLKQSPQTGVILTSFQSMIQNYHAALAGGADYFLEKPFDTPFLFSLIERFFKGTLKPDPFLGKLSGDREGQHCYITPSLSHTAYLKFWGTRGSTPVAGPQYARFGGNTPCLEVKHGKDRIIIDAGTGIRALGKQLHESGEKIHHLFIGHTHWDHLIGFPFFSPIYDPSAEIHIYAPVGFSQSPRDVFFEIFAHSYFPVRLDDIKANIIYHELRDGDTLSIGSIEVQTHYAFHPGSTLCFKVTFDGNSYGYISDNEFLMGYHGDPKKIQREDPLLEAYQSQLAFFQGCKILIHEAHFTPLEYQNKIGWGHSSVSNAAVFIQHCQPHEWIVTHHNPAHTDEDLLKKAQTHTDLLEHLQAPCNVRLAFDELLIPL